MQRRTLLAATGTLLGGLAGCLGGPVGGGATPTDTDSPSPTNSPSPTDSHTATDTPTPGSTPSPTPSLSTSFRVTDRGCGQGANEATIAFDDPIAVKGTIAGSDTCHTAELRAARIEDRELVVRVAAVVEDSEGTAACGECIVDIDYELDVDVSGAEPERARVIHDSIDGVETVARAER